jgi:hypothetical protein
MIRKIRNIYILKTIIIKKIVIIFYEKGKEKNLVKING